MVVMAEGSEVPAPVYVRCMTPPLPCGVTPLQHQVAGHVHGRRNGQHDNKVGQSSSSLPARSRSYS